VCQPLYLLVQREHHVREAGELEEHEEDELGGQVLPQQLAGAAHVGVKVLLRLRALHGVHHQVHQLLLQHRAALLVLVVEGWGGGGDWVEEMGCEGGCDSRRRSDGLIGERERERERERWWNFNK